MSKSFHEVVRTVLARHNIERVLSPNVEAILDDMGRKAGMDDEHSRELREPIVFYLRKAGEREPPVVAEARAVEVTRRRIDLLEELLTTYTPGSVLYERAGELLRHEKQWEIWQQDLGMRDRLPGARPTTAKHTAAKGIYKCIAEAVSLWQACEIIAELYTEAGIDDRPAEKIRRGLYDKLKREVREVPNKPGYS